MMYSIYRSKEDNKYLDMMGIYPERYHDMQDKEVKRIYDHRAMALLHYYQSTNDKTSIQILTKHHTNCATYMAQFKVRERE